MKGFDHDPRNRHSDGTLFLTVLLAVGQQSLDDALARLRNGQIVRLTASGVERRLGIVSRSGETVRMRLDAANDADGERGLPRERAHRRGHGTRRDAGEIAEEGPPVEHHALSRFGIVSTTWRCGTPGTRSDSWSHNVEQSRGQDAEEEQGKICLAKPRMR